MSQSGPSRLTVMAHQGCQGSYPSNSFGAIVRAFDLAEEVEFDVYRVSSAQGDKIICCHPETYFLFVSKDGMQNSGEFPLTFEEAQEHVWGGTKLMPDVEEILDAWSRSTRSTRLQIELKGPGVPAILVPLLQERIGAGLLEPAKLALTGLCYQGDRSRITDTRSLSKELRLVLPLRGDWQQDGFESLVDVLRFAREQDVWMITIQRKQLLPEIVETIRASGFTVGTFHGRTSDEFEAALALGVSYIAADRFESPTIEGYQNVHGGLTRQLYADLFARGFYLLRDWIWEIGWLLEKEVRSMNVIIDGNAPSGLDASCVIDDDGIILRLFDAATWRQQYRAVSLTEWEVPAKFLGEIDRSPSTLLNLISREGIENTLRSVFGRAVSLERAIDWSERVEDRSDASPSAVLSREVLIRAGRLLGMVAFSALNPRHTEKEDLTIGVSCSLCSLSRIARRAAREQVEAQALRSGRFSTSIRFF